MDFFTDDQIRQLIKERNLKTAADVQNMLKEMFGKTLQQMLEAELENELGYSKYNTKDKRLQIPETAIVSRKSGLIWAKLSLIFPGTVTVNLNP